MEWPAAPPSVTPSAIPGPLRREDWRENEIHYLLSPLVPGVRHMWDGRCIKGAHIDAVCVRSKVLLNLGKPLDALDELGLTYLVITKRREPLTDLTKADFLLNHVSKVAAALNRPFDVVVVDPPVTKLASCQRLLNHLGKPIILTGCAERAAETPIDI